MSAPMENDRFKCKKIIDLDVNLDFDLLSAQTSKLCNVVHISWQITWIIDAISGDYIYDKYPG